MSYAVIHGHFVSKTSNLKQSIARRPNAGTVHFKPHAAGQRKLGCDFGLQPGPTGVVEVRLEGVEALEIEFMGHHQDRPLAELARARVLQALGVLAPATDASMPQGPRSAEGYLLTRSVDRGGRLIAFAFAGTCPAADGTQLFVEASHAAGSVNALLLREGLAYASCYDSLPAALRADLVELSRRARGKNLGLWPHAVGLPGRPLQLTSHAGLDGHVMFPKLFRRLVEYSKEQASTAGQDLLDGFAGWLKRNPHRDEMVLLPNQEMGRLHDVIEIGPQQVRLKRNSEEFIVLKSSAAPLARKQGQNSDSPLRIIAAVVEPLDSNSDHKTVTLLNTTARSIDLESFSLRDRVGRALELQGDLGPGEARRFRLGHLLLGADRLFGLSLLNGNTVVDHVAFSPRDGQAPGASLVF